MYILVVFIVSIWVVFLVLVRVEIIEINLIYRLVFIGKIVKRGHVFFVKDDVLKVFIGFIFGSLLGGGFLGDVYIVLWVLLGIGRDFHITEIVFEAIWKTGGIV